MKSDIAKHEPAHCLCPGLFISNKRPKRPEDKANAKAKATRPKLDITYKFNDIKTIKFVGPEQLGADDLLVLQGLIALAGRDVIGLHELSAHPKTDAGKILRAGLQITNPALSAVTVKCSYRAFFSEVGMSGGGAQIKQLHECLQRLFGVSIIVTEGRKWSGYHLLSVAADTGASLHVALNPAVAVAITGGQFVRIDMQEVRALKSAPARLIHQRLCAFINPGSALSVSLDKLMGYVWADQSSNVNTTKTRRQAVRKSLGELQGLGWSVIENAGKFRIGRP